jgi:hypothetical protein
VKSHCKVTILTEGKVDKCPGWIKFHLVFFNQNGRDLANRLATLFWNQTEIVQIMNQAGIKKLRINIAQSADLIWHEILKEAANCDLTRKLVETVVEKFVTNPSDKDYFIQVLSDTST